MAWATLIVLRFDLYSHKHCYRSILRDGLTSSPWMFIPGNLLVSDATIHLWAFLSASVWGSLPPCDDKNLINYNSSAATCAHQAWLSGMRNERLASHHLLHSFFCKVISHSNHPWTSSNTPAQLSILKWPPSWKIQSYVFSTMYVFETDLVDDP